MTKSRSGQLPDPATPARVTPFSSPDADLPFLRRENGLYSRKEHKMNDFVLSSILVSSASAIRRLEPSCDVQTTAALEIDETHGTRGADVAFVRPKCRTL